MTGGLTYDTGALLAGEAGRHDLWALHQHALRRGIRPVVPTVVLAQAWRGGPQPLLCRLLRGCVLDPFTEGPARAAGAALAVSVTADVVDAAVVVGAATRSDAVVTTDPADLRRLATALGAELRLQVV